MQPGGERSRSAGPAMRHGVMLEVNESLVLDLVRSRGETTRPEIGAELGLSAATVSRIVRRLIEQGLFAPVALTGVRWMDVDTPEDYAKAELLLAAARRRAVVAVG